MNISINTTQYRDLSPEAKGAVEAKLAPIERLLGTEGEKALLEIEISHAPAEGRSATPTHVVARLVLHDRVYHAEAVKPTPESAADRVRSTIEAEIRHVRGKGKGFIRRSAARMKDALRFGR